MKSSSEHWDSIFSDARDSKLGWYEKDAEKTLELLEQIPDITGSIVFLPGAGTSVLVELPLFEAEKFPSSGDIKQPPHFNVYLTVLILLFFILLKSSFVK